MYLELMRDLMVVKADGSARLAADRRDR